MKKKIFNKYDVLNTDRRGSIVRLLDSGDLKIISVLKIQSNKGVIRGNHYHKKDIHFTYLVSGKFRYIEQEMKGQKSKKISNIIGPSEMVVSYPETIHAMEFLENSEMIVFTTEPREQKKYEHDTVRTKLI